MKQSRLLKTVSHCIIACCMCALSTATHAHLFTASGSITTPDGITGLNTWGTGSTTLTWDILHSEHSLGTLYTYTFVHPEASTFEFILEVHPNMVTTNPVGVEIYNVSSTLPN